MEIIYSLILFCLCLNVGIFFVSETLNIEKLKALQILNETELLGYNSVLDEVTTNSTVELDASLIFGDFIKGVNLFFALVSLGYIFKMMTAFGLLNENFVLPMSVVGGFVLGVSVIFLISGRGSKSNM